MQVPHQFFRAVCDFELPSYSSYAVGTAFLPGNTDAVEKTKAHIGRPCRRRGTQSTGLARRPDPPGVTGRDCARLHADLCPNSSWPARAAGVLGMALERMAFCLRKRAEHETRCLLPLVIVANARLQGDAHHRAAGPILPRPGRPADRVGDGRRALAILDEHLPVMAARPPVPFHRAQRRDQHRQGQPELDAGARSQLSSEIIPR